MALLENFSTREQSICASCFLDRRLMPFAARCLLALMLCLNGFGMPSAMAHGVTSDGPAKSAAAGSHCHDDMAGPSVIEKSDRAGFPGKHGGSGDCCSNGQCFCGCILSAVFSMPMPALLPPVALAHRLPSQKPGFPAAPSGVLQRPPIG